MVQDEQSVVAELTGRLLEVFKENIEPQVLEHSEHVAVLAEKLAQLGVDTFRKYVEEIDAMMKENAAATASAKVSKKDAGHGHNVASEQPLPPVLPVDDAPVDPIEPPVEQTLTAAPVGTPDVASTPEDVDAAPMNQTADTTETTDSAQNEVA